MRPHPPPLSHNLWERGAEHFENLGADPIDVLQDVTVVEAQDANIDECKLLAAHAVILQAIGILVLRPIYFDREARFGTIEIQDKAANWMLSPEFETCERPRP